MGGPQSAAQKLNRKGARKHGRPSSTMKPEQFAQGERVRPFKPLNLRVNVDNLEDANPTSPQTVDTSPVEKHVVDTKTASSLAKPLYPRGHFSSSFLQPEQFFAELRVNAGAAHQLDLSVDVSRRLCGSEPPNKLVALKPPSPHLMNLPEPHISKGNGDGSEGTQQVFHVTEVVAEPEAKPGPEKDLESFYKPANSVPTLELCYEGKPAPAPAHLRTRTAPCPPTNSTLLPGKLNNIIVSESAQPVSDKNSEEPSDSCAAVDAPHSSELQKSSSHGSGRFFKGGGPSLHKMREKLVRSLSGNKENSLYEGGDAGIQGSTTSPHCQPIEGDGCKQTGRLRRMLHWGASRTGSMEFLKSVERKLGKKSGTNGQIGAGMDSGDKVEKLVGASQSEQEVSGCGESALDREIFDEECCSPRSSASSVSTTYSEVSSKSQSYKQSHKKNHRSEVVKSKLWALRVHEKFQGGARRESEDEDDGIFEALRQGAMLDDITATDTAASKEEDGKILNGSEKNSVSKLVAKHKRNSTWDAGKLNLTDHIFSPKQPRLPTRDAHVLLAPPKRLIGDTREPDLLGRKGKPSLLNTPDAPEHQAAASLIADEYPQISQAVNPTTTRHGIVLPPLPSQESCLKSVASTATSLGRSARRALQNHTVSPGRAELPTSPASPGNLLSSQRSSFRAFPGFTSPLPLPRMAETQSTPTSPGLSATSPGLHSVPKSPPTLNLAGRGGMQITSTSPTLHGASPTSPGLSKSPGGAGFQSSLMVGSDATSRTYAGSRRLNSVEQFSLEQSPSSMNSSSVQATRVAPQEPRSRSHRDLAVTRNGVKEPKPREPSVERVSPDKHKPIGGNALSLPTSSRPQGLSFEQIVAGRGRSPPTDNTLMKFFFKCREIEHLNKFLALQKRRFLDSSSAEEKCFHMILSEAGAGLSSIVSTICTAWLLENTMASVTAAKWHPIPVMNMCQKDIWQHRDAAWLFHVCGIDANAVLFLDEITPTNETVISGRVKRVVIGQDILVTKDEVASCCTIVSEKFRQEAPKLLQARYMMTLLLAGILVDTQNLSSGSSRDKQQATILLVGAGSLGRNGFYNHLMNIRDEEYVTLFIKEIYGDSNALTGERPAQLSPVIEQSKTMSSSLQNDKMPASLAVSKVSSEVTAPIFPQLPSEKSITKPSHKSEFEARSYVDTKESPSKRENPRTQARAPQNSKISLVFRLLRNRSSVQ